MALSRSHGLQATNAISVTPSDTVVIGTNPEGYALYIGTGGNVAVTTITGQTITFSNFPSGSLFPVLCSYVKATNTTASNIIALS